MSTLLFGTYRDSVPQNEKDVRTTVTVVDNDAPPSMQEQAPDFNDVKTDPYTEGGLTTHQLASRVTPSEKYVPHVGNSNDADAMFGRVNDQVSTSGTAAAREMAGQWGHGTMMVVEGIEPTIVDGHAMGDEYFDAGKHKVQAGAGNYMTPSRQADNTSLSEVQATGNENARAAASPYALMLANQMGG